MKKRILYVGNFLFPNDGAAAKRVLNIGRALSETNFEVFYFGNNEEGRQSDLINKNLFKYENFYYYTKPLYKGLRKKISGYYSFKRIRDVIIDIENNFGEIDIIIGYHMDSIGMLECIQYCKKNNKKFISDCTEWYDPLQTIGGKFGLNYFNSQIRMKYVNKKSDGILCISEFLGDYYRKTNKVMVIPSLEKMDEEQQLLIDIDNEIKFVYCGSPGKKDDIVTIINAFKLIKQIDGWSLTIVGISKKDFIKEYKEPLNSLSRNIVFIGRIPYEEAISIVKKSTFSILMRPSEKRYTQAGFPSKVPESMALATPMICNYSSDLKRYVHDMKNGIVVNDNSVLSLKESIDQVMNLNKLDIIKIQKTAFSDAKQYFDYRIFSLQLNDFIKNMILE